jgi:hypothetical protein
MDVSDIVASSRVRGEAAAPPVETEEEPLEDVEEVEEEAGDLEVEEEGAADESEAGVTRPAE